jgi:hypothetical protein
MTTTFDRSLTSSSPGGCKLHIHRPISSRTAFGHILAIPFRYAWYDHTLCTKPSERSWMRKPSRICLAEMEKPLTRKLGTLASMKCDDGAYIYAQSTSIKWQTSLHLHPSPLPFFKPMLISNDRDVETTIELLLIAERHADPGAVARLDAQMWRESWDGEICKGKERYDERTWDVEGTLEGMTLFVDKVRLCLCFAFRRMLIFGLPFTVYCTRSVPPGPPPQPPSPLSHRFAPNRRPLSPPPSPIQHIRPHCHLPRANHTVRPASAAGVGDVGHPCDV